MTPARPSVREAATQDLATPAQAAAADGNVWVWFGAGRFKVRNDPARLLALAELLERSPARLAAATRRSAQAGERRAFPAFAPGMSTADYVAAYERMNADSRRHSVRLSCPWGDLNRAPATLYAGGASDAEPIAEALPDLVQLAELQPVAEPAAELPPLVAELPPAAPASVAPVLAAWQAAAARAGAEPAAAAGEAEALAGACLARYGCTDPAACLHLASFGTWHAATLAGIRAAAAAPAPAATQAARPAQAPTQAPHPRMAEALAILAAAVAPQAPQVPPHAVSPAQVPAAVPAAPQVPAAAPPSLSHAHNVAVHLAQQLVQHVGPDPARLAPALRREAARVAGAAARMLEQAPRAGASLAASYRDTAAQLKDMAAELETPLPAEHAAPARVALAAAHGAARPADAAPAGGRLPTHPRRWLQLLQVPAARLGCTWPPPAARPARAAGAWVGLAPGHRRRGPPGQPWHPPPRSGFYTGTPAARCGFYTGTPAARCGFCTSTRPAMTSKHYRWQTRWQLDQAAGTATHECGLIVTFTAASGPDGEAVNGPETLAALAVKNGPHNAPNMLRRLLKEAAELHHQAPYHAHR